ncbi:uncharacterized protein LOC135689600 [Rhopilema esculentum]|uniref:uncharacterized protein LOC135689600 n=1 Tax=Rhopilema esculentum TaxID=499914 RepID=UPI0031D3A507|eukprot:gene8769-14794_t
MNTALQLYDGKLSLITVPIPNIKNGNDVLVKVRFCGICGTDLNIIKGQYPAAKKIVMGHEFSGIVTAIGKDVKHLSVGDRVCVNPTSWCGTCHYCTRGNPQFCTKEAMHTAHGFHKDGGFQQYCLLASHLCYKLPEDMPLEQAIFCQPMSEICRGWDNLGNCDSDAKILVCGAGLIGLQWASLFHFHGYRDVTITETAEARREMAANMHIGYRCVKPKVVRAEADLAEKNCDETWGFDVIIDCTGNPNAVEYELRWVRKGATILLFGVCPKGAIVNFEPFQVYAKEVKIVHSYLNKFTYPKTIRLVSDMAKKYLDWGVLGVKTFSIQDYEEAFSCLDKGEITKGVFEF